jgi:hypothetical protein
MRRSGEGARGLPHRSGRLEAEAPHVGLASAEGQLIQLDQRDRGGLGFGFNCVLLISVNVVHYTFPFMLLVCLMVRGTNDIPAVRSTPFRIRSECL